METPLLQVRDISKTFPGVKALDAVCFDILPGEVHALVGENGAGKSTFIKILAGVQPPDPGGVLEMDGEPVSFSRAMDAIHKGISVIYQDFTMFPNLSVAENIMATEMIHRGRGVVRWKGMLRGAGEALASLGVEDIDPGAQLDTLSVARQQMVAIAGAIAQNARMIIMDEPTSSLSRVEIENLYRIVERLKAQGIAILFISHKLDEIFRLSDRITVFRDGKYICTNRADEVDAATLISQMVGRQVEIVSYANLQEKPEVRLEVEGLSQKGSFRDISFQVRRGEIVGISGLVGAGRSEVAQTLFGIRRADAGRVLVDGREVRIVSPRQALAHGIAYIPENRQTEGLVLEKSIESNITLPQLDRYTGPFGLVRRRSQRGEADGWVEKLDVRPPVPSQLAMNLSGGNQQKVVLAKWIATGSKVLIVDEPTNGVDVGAKQEIYKILRGLADEGASVIVISSELPEILSVSDRILVMRKGRISGEFVNDGVTQEMLLDKAL